MNRYKIGVYGSAGGEPEINKANQSAQIIGNEIARANSIIITGACPGLPYAAAVAAKNFGGEVWGFSPLINQKEHNKYFPGDDREVYKKMVFVPKSFDFSGNLEVGRKYRNVVSTANVDAGIIIAGRWGTMHEFCALHDYGKVIGILKGSGGFADDIPKMLKTTTKKSKAKIFVESSPKKLVSLILKELNNVASKRKI